MKVSWAGHSQTKLSHSSVARWRSSHLPPPVAFLLWLLGEAVLGRRPVDDALRRLLHQTGGRSGGAPPAGWAPSPPSPPRSPVFLPPERQLRAAPAVVGRPAEAAVPRARSCPPSAPLRPLLVLRHGRPGGRAAA